MLSSEKFILSVSTLAGSDEITLTKRIALTPHENSFEIHALEGKK